MKRLLALLTVCLLLAGIIPMTASAESKASKVDLVCTVTQEGDCLVTMNVSLNLDTSYPRLTFPLPPNAKNISMNGASVGTNKTDSAVNVDISKMTNGYVGELGMRFEYTIPEAVKVDPEAVKAYQAAVKKNPDIVMEKLKLELPMLSGFQFPVEELTFVVSLPAGQLNTLPDFRSTYRQTSFGSDLEVLPISGNQIIGSSKVPLNDHEGVSMTMMLPEAMFPSVSTYIREGNPEIIPMLICAGLALLYWIFFLSTKPLIPIRTSTPPEGITAGELGCRLTQAGGDLTSMVFSWAQLGYLIISLDGNGRVLLHKRMDMGNERNAFENKVYKLLFGSRRVVDATGYPYAKLCRRVAEMVPNERNMHKVSSGSKKIYKLLCCGSMVFCGICVAMNMTSIPALQILLSVILGIFGVLSGWLILGMAYRTHLRGKVPVLIGFVCMLIWILLGLLCGQVWIPLVCVLAEMLLGYPAAYGGRRSDLGRHDAGQVLGLRRYLKRLSKNEISRMLDNDPEFYFHMAPHALALGVINPYSKRFGERKIPQCPYLITRIPGKRTADEWGILIAKVADMMDAKERRMQIEKWTAVQIQTVPFVRRKPAKPVNQKKKRPAR